MPRTGVSRPRRRPDAVIADKTYTSRAIRQTLRRRGIQAVIPEQADRRPTRWGAAGPAPGHRLRTLLQPAQFRGVATLFDKLSAPYRTELHLVALILWLREPRQDQLSERVKGQLATSAHCTAATRTEAQANRGQFCKPRCPQCQQQGT